MKIKSLWKISLLALGLLAFFGCSDEDNPLTSTGSCSLSTTVGESSSVSCLEYANKASALLSEVETACVEQGAATEAVTATWANSACDRTNSVGTCAVGSGVDAFTTVYSDGYTVEVAETACTQQDGVFTAS